MNQSVGDLNDEVFVLSGLPTSVKQEVLNEELVDHNPDEGVNLREETIANTDTDLSDTSQDGGVRRSRRKRTTRKMYVPSMRGKTYTKENHEGVGFPTIS